MSVNIIQSLVVDAKFPKKIQNQKLSKIKFSAPNPAKWHDLSK